MKSRPTIVKTNDKELKRVSNVKKEEILNISCNLERFGGRIHIIFSYTLHLVRSITVMRILLIHPNIQADCRLLHRPLVIGLPSKEQKKRGLRRHFELLCGNTFNWNFKILGVQIHTMAWRVFYHTFHGFYEMDLEFSNAARRIDLNCHFHGDCITAEIYSYFTHPL